MADVSDTSSHRRDQIRNFAEILRNAPAKQKVFEAVYHGKKREKSIGEIAKATKYSAKRVAEIAKHLARGERLFEQGRAKVDGSNTTVYSKIDFLTTNKKKILSLARDKTKLKKFHAKTNPNFGTNIDRGQRIVIRSPFKVRTRFIHAEDVEEFSKVRKTKLVASLNPPRLPEARVKQGIIRLLGETKIPKDWGGENNDIFTRVTVFGRKRRAAFALKGPAKTGPLVPKMMGKNGDQIQRLMGSPASVFFVQYEGEIKESIYKLMEELAKAKAIVGGEILWGVIDDEATKKLRSAYPRAFRK